MQADRCWSSHWHRHAGPTRSLRWRHPDCRQKQHLPALRSPPVLERSDAPADFKKRNKQWFVLQKNLFSLRIEKSSQETTQKLKFQWIVIFGQVWTGISRNHQKPWHFPLNTGVSSDFPPLRAELVPKNPPSNAPPPRGLLLQPGVGPQHTDVSEKPGDSPGFWKEGSDGIVITYAIVLKESLGYKIEINMINHAKSSIGMPWGENCENGITNIWDGGTQQWEFTNPNLSVWPTRDDLKEPWCALMLFSSGSENGTPVNVIFCIKNIPKLHIFGPNSMPVMPGTATAWVVNSIHFSHL